MINHTVGPYSVFTTRELGKQFAYQILYFGALKVGANLIQGGKEHMPHVPDTMRETWEEFGSLVTLPFEKEISPIKEKPSADDLDNLTTVIKKILCEFGYFGDFPKVKNVPPLGTTLPMTRCIRLTDPGFIKAGAWTHYNLLASLIEEKLTKKTGIHVSFHVAGEIHPTDEFVHFEFGFVTFYYLDLSIFKKSDTHKDERNYLNGIRDYFSSFLPMEVEEYQEERREQGEKYNKILHYRVKMKNKEQIDEYFTFRARSLRKNAEIFKELQLKSNRAWVPWQEWSGDPFAVVDFVTNMGSAFDDYHNAMRETFPLIGYCIHVEKISSGFRIHFKEDFDFDILFLNQIDDAAIREHYKALGVTSEEFFARRKQSIQEIFAELQQDRIFKLKEKRKKKSTAESN